MPIAGAGSAGGGVDSPNKCPCPSPLTSSSKANLAHHLLSHPPLSKSKTGSPLLEGGGGLRTGSARPLSAKTRGGCGLLAASTLLFVPLGKKA